jgi:hypothetical protein
MLLPAAIVFFARQAWFQQAMSLPAQAAANLRPCRSRSRY